MKILVAGCRGIPGVPGGIETHCRELYPRLAAAGLQITVACRRPYAGQAPAAYRGVRLIYLPSTRRKGLEPLLHTFCCIWYAALHGYRLLHIHGIGPSLLTPLARLLGRRVVVTNHGPDYMRQKWGRFGKRVLRLGERLGMAFANRVIVISSGIRENAARRYGRRDCLLIPNGITLQERSPSTAYPERLGLKPGCYFLTVGRFVPEKGFHDLVAAYSRLPTPGPGLVLVGDTFRKEDYSTRLLAAARQAGCVVTGFLDGEPLRQLYSHARCFVLPSYIEGLSLALLEALAFGLDVLASRIPANLEIGLAASAYFPAGDVACLAAALQKRLAAPVGIPAGYRQLVAEKYNWDRIAGETAAVYRPEKPQLTAGKRSIR